MPAQKTGNPVAMMPALSRASPSVTNAATPLFFISPAARSPNTAVFVNASLAQTMTSPACASCSAPNMAAMSAG